MGVKESVFASKAEKRNYDKLSRSWGDKYNLYHNLPFLNVFDFRGLRGDDGLSITLNDIDQSRLKKTSVDYVICDDTDHPIICIDFDGMNDGINVGTQYIPSVWSQPNEWRQIIMDLKLKVAHGSNFPYFIVGSREFEDISLSIKLNIVDGIIGAVLARKARQSRFEQGFDPSEVGLTQQEFDNLRTWDQNDLIQDWAIGVEVDAEMNFSPLANLEIQMEMNMNIKSHSQSWMPPNAVNDPSKVWSTVTLHTDDFGDVSSSVWVPNGNSRFFDEYSVATSIATVLACEKLKNLRK